MVWMVYK